ncbi:hypothetical protein ACVDG8_036430 [Mesorhizobium sp. ORM8.1]
MPAPSRIDIVETGNELTVRNPPRRSVIRVGFLATSIAIVVITARWGLFDRSPGTIAMGLFGLLSFLAIFALFAYFLGTELAWLASGGEELRITRDSEAVAEAVSRFTTRNNSRAR